MGEEIVDLYVGTGANRKLFRVHKTLLCNRIPYFKKMFSGGFKEATENTAEFPEDSPEAFDILQGWVYKDTLPKVNISTVSGNGYKEAWNIVDLYMLADKFCFFSLRDEIVNIWVWECVTKYSLPSISSMTQFYGRTPAGSGLRKLALHSLHYIMYGLDNTDSPVHREQSTSKVQAMLLGNHDFLADYLKLSRQHQNDKPAQNIRYLSKCSFHGHGNEEPCTIRPSDT